MQVPVVRQRRGNDCGLAALATVVAHHGRPAAYHELAGRVVLDRDGTDLLTLARLAERVGFRTRGVKASYEAIPGCPLPAIAHVRCRLGSGHFVVLHRWTPEYVVVADPARGLRRLSRRAFCRRSTRYLLIVQPS